MTFGENLIEDINTNPAYTTPWNVSNPNPDAAAAAAAIGGIGPDGMTAQQQALFNELQSYNTNRNLEIKKDVTTSADEALGKMKGDTGMAGETPGETPTDMTAPPDISSLLTSLGFGTMDEFADGTTSGLDSISKGLDNLYQYGAVMAQSDYEKLRAQITSQIQTYKSSMEASVANANARADKYLDWQEQQQEIDTELNSIAAEESSLDYSNQIDQMADNNGRLMGFLQGKFAAAGMLDSSAGLQLIGKYMGTADMALSTLQSKSDMARRYYLAAGRKIAVSYAEQAWKVEMDCQDTINQAISTAENNMNTALASLTTGEKNKNEAILGFAIDSSNAKLAAEKQKKDDIRWAASYALDQSKFEHQVAMDAATLSIEQANLGLEQNYKYLSAIDTISKMDIDDQQKDQLLSQIQTLYGNIGIVSDSSNVNNIGSNVPNADNCVLYSRESVPNLPYGLFTIQDKVNAVNVAGDRDLSKVQVGDALLTSEGEYGHVAVVTGVNGDKITVREANYKPGQVTSGRIIDKSNPKILGFVSSKTGPQMNSQVSNNTNEGQNPGIEESSGFFTQGGDQGELTAMQVFDVDTIAREIFGQRAVSNPDLRTAVEEAYKEQGRDKNKTLDYLRTSGYSPLYSGDYRDAAEAIAMKLSADKRDVFTNSLDRSLEEGNITRAKNLIKEGARMSLNAAEEGKLRGYDITLDFINSIESDLAEFESIGGDTGIFSGNIEKAAQRIGFSTSDPLAKIRTKILTALLNYRRSMTGVAFGKEESKEYASIFPDIASVKNFNASKISALKESFEIQSDSMYEQLLGDKTYNNIFKQQTGEVNVISPDGTPGTIPSDQLEEALKLGYKQQ
jgi:ElaB/YqjD/DUF883 family membrane-anchored ribosome-binding protein